MLCPPAGAVGPIHNSQLICYIPPILSVAKDREEGFIRDSRKKSFQNSLETLNTTATNDCFVGDN